MKRPPFSICQGVRTLIFASLLSQAAWAQAAPFRTSPARSAVLWNLPLSFEGTESEGSFRADGLNYSILLNATGASLSFASPPPVIRPTPVHREFPRAALGNSVRLELVGANPRAEPRLLERLQGTKSYFIGNDPSRWRTRVPTFGRVEFSNIYPGVDWICYGNQGRFEYDFRLAPGARPESIRLRVEGADRLRIDPVDGSLVLEKSGVELRQPPARVYQEGGKAARVWQVPYELHDGNSVGFQMDHYDVTRPLVIDPSMVYSSVWGRTNELDLPYSLAVDGEGNAYVAGTSAQTNQTPRVFVLKLAASGTNLIYSAVFGGSKGEVPGRIAVDATGSAYLTGTTKSADFPVWHPLQSSFHGPSDAFVCKLSPDGSAFAYATYLGGSSSVFVPNSGLELGFGIAIDGDGAAYVTGSTTSADLFGPGVKHIRLTATQAGPVQSTLKGPSDAFLAKLAPDGSRLVYGTYLGGSGYEAGLGVALDSQTNACLIGLTKSTDFPVLNAEQDKAGGGGSDAFVAKVNSNGTALLFATYLGGSGDELPSSQSGVSIGADLVVDGSDSIYVVGDTLSTNFPTKSAYSKALRGSSDGFVSKFNAQGGLVYSTYLGGSSEDGAFAVAVDSSGNAYVTGGTGSSDFPLVQGLQTSLMGSSAGFLSVLDPAGSSLLFSTYWGADSVSLGNGIAVDSSGNAYLAGFTTSTNFPNTLPRNDGLRTIFVAKFALGLVKPATPSGLIRSFGFDPKSGFALQAQGQANHAYVVEFSSDLKQWISVDQFNTPDGRTSYSDSRAVLFPHGFYRVR